MTTPYQLVSSPISGDTVDACRELLAAAEGGHITGLGVIIFLKRRRFIVDVFGEAQRDPVFARGALQSLDDCLRHLVSEKSDQNTTL